jgi:endonuclease I
MRKVIITLCTMLLTLHGALAQGPNGSGKYYKGADGKSGAALKTALHRIIRNPKVVGYGGLKEAYSTTDTRPDGYLRDWYSDSTFYEPGSNYSTATKAEGLGYNREHLLPQSWFGKGRDPMYSDITHVVPTDARLNSIRNDNPFGEVTDQTAQVATSETGFCRWGAPNKRLGTPTGLTKVFEPNDSEKGDIARIYFYMMTCYEDTIGSWRDTWTASRTAPFVFAEEGTAYEPLQEWVMTMFMRWSEQDPVDSIETARNNSVFNVQGNRNPFVDYPGLEQMVWGEQRDVPFVYDDGSDPREDEPLPAETVIALNNQFFGNPFYGQRKAGNPSALRAEQDGVTVEYCLGNEGRNMYMATNHIRLYQKNLLCFSVYDGLIQEIDFNVTKNDSQKIFIPSEGTMDDYHWTGSTDEVKFSLDDGNGVLYLAGVTIRMAEASGIELIDYFTFTPSDGAFYDLQGRKVGGGQLRRGLYICNGKKVFIQ